ncbi:MAG: tetratricopeptide repeat protein [Pseudomonadota bacterium]|nr:tetratricopeptide repeat protein [Pseudomonadota bacterium]
MTRWAWLVFGGFLLISSAFAQESFRVELGRDGETIADMRPVFLKFETRPMPAISPSEVARRYQRLFNTSDEPEVRIDALNRLSNIRDQTGQDLGLSAAQESRVYGEILTSYETILGRGTFSGRLDELLYQMAKAYALTGQSHHAIDRLKQLVGLYPHSALVPEARFRIAESAFAEGRYAEAEAGYRALIESDAPEGLKTKARYMLGWSQFKQGSPAWERSSRTFVMVLNTFLPDTASVERPGSSTIDTIDDTLRVLAMMAAREDGPDRLEAWLAKETPQPWAHLLFDRLADYYAQLGDYEASAATNSRFVRLYPDHSAAPAFMAQNVQVWQRAGQPASVRDARAEYVAMYDDSTRYRQLSGPRQEQWQAFSRRLADHFYSQGSDALERNERSAGISAFSRAAGYYESLASRSVSAGELLRLAGDARLQAGHYDQALANYQAAAYGIVDYAKADDAAWAAVVLLRDGVENNRVSDGFQPDLAALSSEADRFSTAFGNDARLPGLTADLASRWHMSGDAEHALRYARETISHPEASANQRYAAWLVVAKTRQQQTEYALAEKAWSQVLLVAEEDASVAVRDDRDQAKRQIATVVYRQGETAAREGNILGAVGHFKRIEAILPASEIAIKGRYDAANTLLKSARWDAAVTELVAFREDFPGHDLAEAISEKLVYAYVESDQPVLAASELLKATEGAADPWSLKLRAASLFHQAGDVASRNRLYLSYFDTTPVAVSPEEHIQLQTFRYRLIDSLEEVEAWRESLVRTELESQWHSEQTLAWAARSALILGARDAATFAAIPLNQPLSDALDRKQGALESARQRFLQAEKLGGESVRSESLYRRAELYRGLARDLMASAVPVDLNELEAMQYQMLLEEEAFPFEEQALGLHAENHQRIAEHGYDAWIGRSLGVLSELNPGRYDRAVRWMSWSGEISDGV